MTNPLGGAFVEIYYTASPPIADVIRENEGLRTIAREGLVKPLVYILRIIAVPAAAAELPDLNVTAIDAYHYNTYSPPWFNLSNEIDINVSNIGDADAGAFNVGLYADDEYIEKKTVSGLEAGNSTIVQFKWTPIGDDCFDDCIFTDTSKDYNLKAIADCDNNVAENDETNNNLTKVEKACYNGYIADEPLENVFHGTIHGGLIFTTGDGTYGGLSPYRNTTYEITLPTGATVELARLNVYYTWHYEKDSCPQMEVSITNETGTYVVPLDGRYNDIKCQCPGVGFVYPWGNYVYNLTCYITGNGTYTVSVKKTGGPSFCIAAPGIEVLYRDENKPLIEVWLNEGADVLLGGRRSDGGYLALEECIANTTFTGSIDLSKVKNATLAVVAPWGDSFPDDVLYFNDVEIGRGVYLGYHETVDETVGGVSMHIGSTNAQVGVNVTDVTSHLRASDNVVGQGDDGDCMMPSNAFLVVEYTLPFDTGPGTHPSIRGTHEGTITLNHTMRVSRMYTYPCFKTDGHSEFVAFYNSTTGEEIANGTWIGTYLGPYQWINFDKPFTLYKDITYNYTIVTGSYPQIIHEHELTTSDGKITCTKFTDANGQIYYDWIPAIKL